MKKPISAAATDRKTIKIDPKVHHAADVESSRIGVPLYEFAEAALGMLIPRTREIVKDAAGAIPTISGPHVSDFSGKTFLHESGAKSDITHEITTREISWVQKLLRIIRSKTQFEKSIEENLDGFCLGQPVHYPTFAFKRICRIWIPYLAALVFACLVRAAIGPALYAGASPVSAVSVANAVSLLGYFDSKAFNPVFWSLVHEMRISIAFPLLMLLASKFRSWPRILAAAFALSLIAGAFRKVLHPAFTEDIWNTAHYAAFFLVGYLIAANISTLRRICKFPRLAMLAGICLYTYAWWFLPTLRPIHLPHVNDWVIAAGASLIIASVLSSAGLRSFFALRPIAWLGEVSYSLYLFHFPIMLAAITLLRGIAPAGIAILASIPVILLVSRASYCFVELNAIGLGMRGTTFSQIETPNRLNMPSTSHFP